MEYVEIKIRNSQSGKTIEFKFNPDDESMEIIKKIIETNTHHFK